MGTEGKGARQRFSLPEEENDSKQEAAAKSLKAKIKTAEKEIRRIHERYRQKSRVQLVRLIYLQCGAFAAEFEIARIERNQSGRLTQDERVSLEEDKLFIRQRQLAEKECPRAF